MRKATFGNVWMMVAVALGLRLIVVGFDYDGRLKPSREHFHFAYEEGRVAESIVAGKGVSSPFYGDTGPTAFLPPVYPYLIAGVFRIFGSFTKASAIALLSLDSVFSALTCIPIVLIARKIFGTSAAPWAGWIWVFLPQAIYHSADRIWDTCLSALLLAILVLLTLRLEEAGLAAWAGFGLLFGVTALTNPAVLAVFPFFVGWACYRASKQDRAWANGAAAVVALILVLLPWQARNARIFHAFIPVRDGFWMHMRVGNTGDNSACYALWALPPENDSEMAEYRRVGEIAYMQEKRVEVLRFIGSHGGEFVVTSLRRALFFWTGIWRWPINFSPVALADFDPEELPQNAANILASAALSVLGLIGLIQAWRARSAGIGLFTMLLVVYPLVYYIGNPEQRYRHPIDPELVVLAAWAITGWRSGHFFSPGLKPKKF